MKVTREGEQKTTQINKNRKSTRERSTEAAIRGAILVLSFTNHLLITYYYYFVALSLPCQADTIHTVCSAKLVDKGHVLFFFPSPPGRSETAAGSGGGTWDL